MNVCGDCQKAPNGNCGKHLESYMGAVSHAERPMEVPKTAQQLIQEAVEKALAQEKAKWAGVVQACKIAVPKNHVPCGCKRCFAINQALQGIEHPELF